MMKLLVQSAMIFFGTLMAAGLVALGEPARPNEGQSAAQGVSIQALNNLLASARPWVERTTAGQRR
jgi:hypothetical protein